MSVKHDIRSFLLSQTAVTGLCSTRIYCNSRPQNDPLPAIELSTIGDDPSHRIDGTGGHDTVSLQVDCLGVLEEDADSLDLAVWQSFDGLGGLSVTVGAGNTQIGSVVRGNRVDRGPYPDPVGRDQFVHSAVRDYDILYGTPILTPST